jgi:predicted PP-loop superfamily ATPase
MISLIIRILFNHPINDSLEQYVQVDVRIKVLEYIKDYYKNKIVNVQLKEIIEIKNNNPSDFENYIILLKIYYDIVLYSL